jgi:hypothetical protein
VFVEGSGACGSLHYQLESPGGQPLYYGAVCSNSGPQTLAESGAHRVVVFGDGAATGDYRLRLTLVE